MQISNIIDNKEGELWTENGYNNHTFIGFKTCKWPAFEDTQRAKWHRGGEDGEVMSSTMFPEIWRLQQHEEEFTFHNYWQISINWKSLESAFKVKICINSAFKCQRNNWPWLYNMSCALTFSTMSPIISKPIEIHKFTQCKVATSGIGTRLELKL